MSKLRSYILPMAIILGLLLHNWCSLLAWIVPYFIFIILLLNFVAVNLRKLQISSMHLWLMLFQIVISIGGYYAIKSAYMNETVAQGVLIGVLCPVAASVVVIASMLGANRLHDRGKSHGSHYRPCIFLFHRLTPRYVFHGFFSTHSQQN